jgi:hypothetical protein
MPVARFRFYAELNDFLSLDRRFAEFEYDFLDIATVKDRIESFGVPHVEVDLILVNGQSVDFSHRVQDGDRISIYAVFEAFDIAGLTRLRPEPLRDPRFVLDVHLGRLAAYLRMLGFDSLYQNRCSDGRLAEVSHEEHRILLTRDVGLLKRGSVTHGYYLRTTQPRQQLVEVVRRFDLGACPRIDFSRTLNRAWRVARSSTGADGAEIGFGHQAQSAFSEANLTENDAPRCLGTAAEAY